jgi:tricorn protease-like protein
LFRKEKGDAMTRRIGLMIVIGVLIIGTALFAASPAHAQVTSGQIAFVSNRDGNNQIYIMNADGSDQTRLTNDPAEALQPSLSRDGTKIAFVSTRDGNYQIYTMNADGSNVLGITLIR